jgi:hypothetical protein
MPPTDPTSRLVTDQLTRALGEAVIRIWSNLPQEVQEHLFKAAVSSQGEPIRSQLAAFLHDKHTRTADPLGDPREMKEPLATTVARSNSDDWESGKAPMLHSLLVEPNGRRRYLLQMDCDLQIAPMLTQKLLGLPQCPILGRMRHAHGLTINGPDDNKRFRHIALQWPPGWRMSGWRKGLPNAWHQTRMPNGHRPPIQRRIAEGFLRCLFISVAQLLEPFPGIIGDPVLRIGLGRKVAKRTLCAAAKQRASSRLDHLMPIGYHGGPCRKAARSC